MKCNPSAAKLEVLFVAHKLYEMWNEEFELTREKYLKLLEERGSNSEKQRLQVSTNASNRKPTYSRLL
jgi:hypothetical protein